MGVCSSVHNYGLRGGNFPHLERGDVVSRDRFLFALPDCPDVFIVQAQKNHVVTPVVFVDQGSLHFGGMLDLRRGDDSPLILSVPITMPHPPLIALYRCLRLLSHLRRIEGDVISRLFAAYVSDESLPELEQVWQRERTHRISATTLLHALHTARAHRISTRAVVSEAMTEAMLNRLDFVPEMEQFGILSPQKTQALPGRTTALMSQKGALVRAWLETERSVHNPISASIRAAIITSLAATAEVVMEAPTLIHAFGLAVLIYVNKIESLQNLSGIVGLSLFRGSVGASLAWDDNLIRWADAAARTFFPDEVAPPLASVLPDILERCPLDAF